MDEPLAEARSQRSGDRERGPEDLATVRALVLRAFRWVDGHADIASLLREPSVLGGLGPALAAPFRARGVTAAASPEARGFALGSLVAAELRAGLVLVRKEGSRHPGASVERRSAPDWLGREVLLRLHRASLGTHDRVLVVDDWVETGAQATTVIELIRDCGAVPVGVAALVDDCSDTMRRALGLRGLVRSTELPPDPSRRS